LINKVNAPPKLTLIRASKSMEHDPGASSGSGLGYERPREQNQEENQEEEKDSKGPKLAIVSELEKAGMTEVVKDFYEHRNNETPAPQSPGLSTRYQADVSRTKGLLLNKKAE
jgi:hypothetical protein